MTLGMKAVGMKAVIWKCQDLWSVPGNSRLEGRGSRFETLLPKHLGEEGGTGDHTLHSPFHVRTTEAESRIYLTTLLVVTAQTGATRGWGRRAPPNRFQAEVASVHDATRRWSGLRPTTHTASRRMGSHPRPEGLQSTNSS